MFLGATPGVTTVNIWLQSGEQYRIAVNVTESDINAALATVHQLLQGTENITARIAGNRIVLEGDRVRDADQKRAESITESFGGLVMNFIGKLGWEQMIHFNVKILEVRRTAVRQLGIRWDSTTAGPSVGIASSIDVKLNAVLNSQIEVLEQKGDAYVIAEPTLSCRSGGTAHFVSGGELPIPITDGLGQTTVEFKEFGVILDVKPVSDRTGTIYAQIDTEVSQVDDSVTRARRAGIHQAQVRHRSEHARRRDDRHRRSRRPQPQQGSPAGAGPRARCQWSEPRSARRRRGTPRPSCWC